MGGYFCTDRLVYWSTKLNNSSSFSFNGAVFGAIWNFLEERNMQFGRWFVGGDDSTGAFFARRTAPVVITASIILSSNKIQNGDILVPANLLTQVHIEMAVKTDRNRARKRITVKEKELPLTRNTYCNTYLIGVTLTTV